MRRLLAMRTFPSWVMLLQHLARSKPKPLKDCLTNQPHQHPAPTRVAWPMRSILRAHLVKNFSPDLGLVRFTDRPPLMGFGYRDRVPVLGLDIKQGKPCLASYLIPSAQVQKDRRTVNWLHPCRIPRVGCRSKSRAEIIAENQPES